MLIGKKFNRLTVIEEGEKRGNFQYYLCRCECGEIKNVRMYDLLNNATKSCGCLRRETILTQSKTHGMSGTRFYNIWSDMKQRCQNKNNVNYKNYGGRGVNICERWQKFENFKEDMYESYLKHVKKHGETETTIDRINNSGNYEQNNCRWATKKVQSTNRRLYKNNSSGCSGVKWNKKARKWESSININGERKHLGTYEDKEMAIKARLAYESMYYNTTQIDGVTYDLNLLSSNFYSKIKTEAI